MTDLISRQEWESRTGHTGRGADRKGGKRDGLLFAWQWLRICDLSQCPPSDKRRLPCQMCTAHAGQFTTYFHNTLHDSNVTLEAVAWWEEGEKVYEGVLCFGHKHLASTPFMATRLEAQRGAEQLLVQVADALRGLWGSENETDKNTVVPSALSVSSAVNFPP